MRGALLQKAGQPARNIFPSISRLSLPAPSFRSMDPLNRRGNPSVTRFFGSESGSNALQGVNPEQSESLKGKDARALAELLSSFSENEEDVSDWLESLGGLKVRILADLEAIAKDPEAWAALRSNLMTKDFTLVSRLKAWKKNYDIGGPHGKQCLYRASFLCLACARCVCDL